MLFFILFFNLIFGMDECSICYDSIDLHELDPQKNIITGCSHKYHKKCLHIWFATNQHCPLCRRIITQVFYCAQQNRQNIIGDLQVQYIAQNYGHANVQMQPIVNVQMQNNDLQQALVAHENPDGHCCCYNHRC